MKIFAISDIHGHTKALQSTQRFIKDSDLIVISGDLTRTGSRAEAYDVLMNIEQYNTNIIAVHGNIDSIGVKDLLEEKGYSIHGTSRIINGYGFFGVGGSSPTPIRTPCIYSEAKIMEFLNKGFDEVKDSKSIILISHAPPRGIRDRTYVGLRGGSKSIKKFLSINRVNLCIAGHIHEAYGTEHYNGSIITNPGSLKSGKYLSITIDDKINIQSGKIKI